MKRNEFREVNVTAHKNRTFKIHNKTDKQRKVIINMKLVEKDLDKWICSYLAKGDQTLASKIKRTHYKEICLIRNYMYIFVDNQTVSPHQLLAYFYLALQDLNMNETELTNTTKKQYKDFKNQEQINLRKAL